ncbi:MAG TPA: 16S rRNA (cytidine(1402)-2'-O)-methyltransferase, partial [Acidobacteria bacterium]|nr:16S rRNA (cytidine(1402)-2'-O)-methyltransferase [Acidobacteriota bacterium]
MSGTLNLVATPIGNLEDITLRAVRILGEVQLIAAEDTRRTARLLRHYGITTRTTSLHEHNERQKTATLVARLLAGDSIALLSDAGTPIVSDPGLLLVRQSLDAGIPVVALPGPSAVTAALISSGAPANSFTFVGFPPRRLNARKRWCEALANEPTTLIFFES